jgi:hypothetical protein
MRTYWSAHTDIVGRDRHRHFDLRQINRSVSCSSMRTVALSLKLSHAGCCALAEIGAGNNHDLRPSRNLAVILLISGRMP